MNQLSLKDFLKKYSTLSNDFIDDFYSIYDFNEEEKPKITKVKKNKKMIIFRITKKSLISLCEFINFFVVIREC